MLINIINNKLINTLKQFLNSKWMMFLIVAAAAISNLFGLEIITYYIYTGIIIFTILFNEAMLPLFPIPCVAYMTFAKRNQNYKKRIMPNMPWVQIKTGVRTGNL